MPRIDPDRLLRCLQPLLEPVTGGIRSSEDVDKILGLMSKFSKKLVSKCIYINILRATQPPILDLFMERGGWALVFGWANDGVSVKNYPLLKEVLNLLLVTPTSVSRLRENKFPVLIKGLSKDCEVEEIKNLAKLVVSKWIAVAKAGEGLKTEPHLQQQQPVQVPIGTGLGLPVESHNFVPDQSGIPAELGNLAMNTGEPLLNIDPTLIPDTENQLMDLDISHTDLANIDFNLDILSKVVDQQNLDDNLGEVASTSTPNTSIVPNNHIMMQNRPSEHNTNLVINNTNVVSNPSITNAPSEHVQTQQQVTEEVYRMIQVQPAPKLYIKTIGGQRTVVQSLGSDSGSFFMVIKDGKNVLMKLKEPSQSVTPLVIQPDNNEVSSTSVVPKSNVQDSSDGKEAKRSKSPKKESVPSNKPKGHGETTLKTYGSSKSKSSSDKDVSKKSNDQNAKPLLKSEKDKDKKAIKEKSSSNEVPRKSKSSSASSKAAQAAAAAKLQAEEEKLREDIRKQKALVKKRAKEAEKQKQVEKDQETLKKLNLAPPTSSASNSSMKIPKIPRKSSSFADAIGIPGSDGSSTADKIKKISPEKSGKTDKSSQDSPTPTPLSPKKFYGRKEEPEENESDKPKERRHKPKVFVSSKSRSDDLLKEMTESGKPKPAKEKEKEKDKEETKPNITLGNSIPAVPPKASKRLSTDSFDKPGETKKPKISEINAKSEKEKAKEKEREILKEKERKKAIQIKESSLFMDMLNASSETTKPSKRKRRPSTSGDKDKAELLVKVPSKEDDENCSGTPNSNSTPDDPVKKPVFNFYRDTLNDSADEDKQDESEQSGSGDVQDMEQSGEGGSFTPQEGDGKIKSALCLVRARNRPRKTVRWREDDELREFHFFEMDETERVNVTKQKEFTEMSQHERQNERFNMRRKPEEEEDTASWRLPKIAFTVDVLNPPCISQEKHTQEEREKNILGLFLPPGSALPDTATEPDIADATIPVDRVELKTIPVEDVNGTTKVCDFRTHMWPEPKAQVRGHMIGYGHEALHERDDIRPVPNLNAFPPPNDYNPWNTSLGFTVPPPPAVPNMGHLGDMSSFQQFPMPAPGALNMNMLNTAQPPPPVAMGFGNPNPFAFPPAMVPPVNGPPPPVTDSFGGNLNRDGRMGMPNRGGRFNDADQRRTFHGRDREGNGRDRGGGNRDRDYRDDRGGRDRDYRRRDRDNNDRDYRFHDKERNNREFRGSGRNIRKDIPCKFFKKGFCHMASRCEFMHDGSNSHDETRNNAHSRQDTFDSGRIHKSPDTNNKDVDLRQSSASSSFDAEEDWEASTSDGAPGANETRFAQPPSSPTEPELPSFSTNAESTKVIPV